MSSTASGRLCASAPDTAAPGRWRAVAEAVRALTLQVDAYVRAVARNTHHHATDVHAIGILKSHGERATPVGPGTLGRVLGLSPAAVSALLDRMESSGHVTRLRGGSDARRVDLAPTVQAAEESRTHFQPMTDRYHAVLDDYTPEQLDLVSEVLQRLTAATAESTTQLDRHS